MPRPPSAASLARRPHPPSAALPSSSATSSAPPKLRRAPSAGNAYSTAAATAAEGDSPGLDFLYPGFGFFSRALPSGNGSSPAYCESVAWSLANGSFAGPPPPPPQPAPSSPSPSSPSTAQPALASPPPPAPQPQRKPFDVRSWRSAEGLAALGARGTLLAGGTGTAAMGRCICGRLRQGCLRCRGASTSATVRRREGVEDEQWGKEEEARIETGKVEKGKGKVTAGAGEGTRTRRNDAGNPEQSRGEEENAALLAASAQPSTSSSRLSRLLADNVPPSLPSIRGSSVAPTPHRSRRRRHSRSHREAVTLDGAEERIAALWMAAQDEAFVKALTEREKLDFVKAFSRLARAVPPVPAAQSVPDPIIPNPPSALTVQAERRLALRHLVSSHALSLLSSLRLWPSSAEPSILPPSSSTHASAALLFLDALALSRSGPSLLSDAILSSPDALPAAAQAARTALDRLFHPSSPTLDPSSSAEQREKRALSLREDQKTALALFLEAFKQSPSSLSTGAEVLLHLVTSSPSATSVLDPSLASSVKDLGYIHVLRRRVGDLLANLSPSPSRWLLRDEDERKAGLGLHLVRFLAPAGNALQALEVWKVVEEGRVRRAEESQARGEVPAADALAEEDRARLAALTTLLEGLTMERYFSDANGLAKELEGLSLTVQEEGVVALTTNEKDVDLVSSAFRALAKLASDQGRTAILDRLLERLAAIRPTASSTSSSSTPSSLILESAARRLRSYSSRYDISTAQATFNAASSAMEFSAASPAEQARLWAQLVLAYTRVNDVEKAVETVQTMAARDGLQVPLSAVNAILYGYARRGDLKTTFELFSQVAEGIFPLVRPDLGSWNALVLACAVGKDPSAAEGVVQEMKAVGVEPNLRTWTTLMNAYVENGQWVAAFGVYRFLDSHNSPSPLRPDTAAVNVMLKACVLTAVPAEQVLHLFRTVIERGIRPNMQTYTLVMQSVCTAGLMDVAEELFLVFDAAERPRSRFSSFPTSPFSSFSSLPLPTPMGVVRPDHFIFANLIAGYLSSGQPEKARAFLTEMRSRGMAPTTTTMGIVLGARLRAHRQRLQNYTTHGVRSVLTQTRQFLEDDLLPVRKKRQPVRVDRSLAHGKEAVALLSPVIRALGRVKDKDAAVEVFEEALQLTNAAREGADGGLLAVELYTSFMDALRRDDNAEEAARNVQVVWQRLYDLVSTRYLRLQTDPSAPPSDPRQTRRLIDPAQASILAVPLTILIETYDRAGWHIPLETTWRRLAEQGFAFDASNWNVLARHFARDLQLDRAMWIVNNVLTVPLNGGFSPFPTSSSSTPAAAASPSPSDLDDFLRDVATIRRAEAVGRVPLRVRSFRNAERDRQRKDPLNLASVLTSSYAPSDAPAASDSISATFADSYALRSATVWHPFGTTLDTLDAALETLTTSGSARSMQLYKKALKKQRAAQRRAQEKQQGKGSDGDYEHVVAEEMAEMEREGSAETQGELFIEPSDEYRAQLLRKYPRAAQAIELYKTRHQRWRKETEDFLERVRRTGGVSVSGGGSAGDGGFA
ncbi:hypothetical protein JCM11251_003879 [Rhodosporidiobolus azoricus]